ncbi:hypothetical protein HS1genome_1756 [Sulfodiicoccus acidiphilus]|uniref:Uncharacterized protein n=1 Tax=Sulfodiicoccus acidiphilus TaxID=1670455 RepID=A0A348B5B5_9CREN|nr:hypothetical protein [Sulfodiicoccus acidiphilus]BBD73367.1 hypothetical protein HS1genome_1756 [Sulfodiicoccus acidiphilus]GGU00961.1 hypothetical protein GCM10007116_17760 [Sulfodiicoccus acidiphilus]
MAQLSISIKVVNPRSNSRNFFYLVATAGKSPGPHVPDVKIGDAVATFFQFLLRCSFAGVSSDAVKVLRFQFLLGRLRKTPSSAGVLKEAPFNSF